MNLKEEIVQVIKSDRQMRWNSTFEYEQADHILKLFKQTVEEIADENDKDRDTHLYDRLTEELE